MFRKNLIIALMAITAGLTGCFKDTLDYRNADVANGLIYKKDMDKPFSGKVTGYPFRDLAGRSVQLFKVQNLLDVHGDGDNLMGAVCDIEVAKGELISEIKCENRLTRTVFEAPIEEGELTGELVIHTTKENTTPRAIFTLKNGRLDGVTQILDRFTKEPIYDSVWDSAQLAKEKIYNKETKLLSSEATYVKGRPHGPTIRYAADGHTVVFSADYENGQINGKMLEVWVAEMTYREGTYVDGSLRRTIHGQVVAEGKRIPTREAIYDQHGVEIVSRTLRNLALENVLKSNLTAIDQEACVDSWGKAFREEVGEDAVVSMDQIGEWEAWCKSGKVPA